MGLVSIGEFARLSRLSAKALRRYDELGLLRPERVDPGSGYRWYETGQLARLVASLRQIGVPLAQIKVILGLAPDVAAKQVGAYWAAVEGDHAARRELAGYLVDRLTGKRTVMYEVATRQVPGRSLLCLLRHVDSQPGIIALGKAEELAAAYPELTLRSEPAHEEAFVHLGTAEISPAQWQVVAQTLQAWGAERHRRASDLGVRDHLLGQPAHHRGQRAGLRFRCPAGLRPGCGTRRSGCRTRISGGRARAAGLRMVPMSYPEPRYHGSAGEISAIVRPGSAEPDVRNMPGNNVRYLATGASTGGQFGLYRWDFGPKRSGPDPHFHRTISESFFVLSGTVRLYDGTSWVSATEGDFLYVPQGGIHGFRNESGQPASMLLLFTPGAPREEYFETLAEVAQGRRVLDDADRAELMIRHDTFWLD